MAPPLAAMVVLLGVVAAGEVSRYRVAEAGESRATVILAVQSLVQELQGERAVTVASLAGNAAYRAQVGPARQRVDARRASVRAVLAGGGALEQEAAGVVGKLDGLAEARGAADTGTGDRDETFEFYTGLIEELGGIYRHLELVADEPLRRGLESLEYLNGVMEATAQEQVLLNDVFVAGGFGPAEYPRFVAMLAARDHGQAEFDEFADPAAASAKTGLLNTAAAAKARALESMALRSGGGQLIGQSGPAWWSAAGTVLADMTRLSKQIGASTRNQAQTVREHATVRLALLAIVVLLCLAGSVYLAASGATSLATPLVTLAGDADRLARERLPEAVRRAVAGDVTGPPEPVGVARGAGAEVRRVADAFARVQETAYRLATEQAQLRRTSAESLANLGRRNQNLLRRQLTFITRLEREESDPTGLANLFELDHLATRMRRNAESLLVLVGAASPRQWSGQLPLTDVIRAAVSEVEEYRRVILRRIDDVLVQGSVATDLAHMLAELIENGLTFSPPDLEVEIHGRRLGDGYLIAICDQGIGLSQDDLHRANLRLRGDGDFLTAPARFLGHHVVGRLAAEMGAEVQLTPSPVMGVTARVRLPARILGEPPSVTAVPDSGPPAPEREPAERLRPRAAEVDYVVVAERVVMPEHAERVVMPQHAERVVMPEHPERVVMPAPAERIAVPAPRAAWENDAERTPNGLRKRLPREHRSRPLAPPPTPRPEPPEPIGSPDATSARLTALRDGIERGHATASAVRARPDHLPARRDLGGVS